MSRLVADGSGEVEEGLREDLVKGRCPSLSYELQEVSTVSATLRDGSPGAVVRATVCPGGRSYRLGVLPQG